MKKLICGMVVLSIAVFGAQAIFAADLYVSPKGKNKAAGTKEAPLKNVWKAIEKASAGDTIHIAGGAYYGKTKRGWVALDKPLTLKGGYSKDFSTRDPLANPTLFQPLNKMNGTKGNYGVLQIDFKGKDSKYVLDGLVFDDGESNSYHETKGKPEGVDTGVLLLQPAKSRKSAYPSREKSLLHSSATSGTTGDLIIQNCVFANGSNYGVQIGHFTGNVKILNNVFINNRTIAADVYSKNAKNGEVTLEFAYNTVLFTWSRKDDLQTMGYGVRANAKINAKIHHNIIGLNVNTGFDMSKGDDKTKKVELDNNTFFLNRKGDMSITVSPSIQNIKVDDFEDMEDSTGIESISDNVALGDIPALKSVLNEPFLKAFLTMNYSEETQYEEDSPENLFREAFGLNKKGKIIKKVSMFGNRYPLKESYKLFGAMKDMGAQAIK